MRRSKSHRHATRGWYRGAWIAVLIGLGLAPLAASAQHVWVKDRVQQLALRSGPSKDYRYVGELKTGDKVQVLRRGDGWTQVRTEDGTEAWVMAGFLLPQPPPIVKLAQAEAQTQEFRTQVEALVQKVEELEARIAELTGTDESQRAELETLTRENLELRAGARWPEWITGAGILGAGMTLGAILHTVTGRRSRPRIRL